MTTEQYGTGDLVFTVAQLIMPFVTLVIYDAVIRYGLAKSANPPDVLLVSMIVLGIGSIVTLVLTPIFALYKPIANWKWELAIYIILSGFYSTIMNYIKVKEKNISYSVISVIDTALMAALNVLFLAVWHLGVDGYLAAYIISFGVCDVIAFFVSGGFNDLRKAKFQKKLFKEMLLYSSPLIFNNVSWWTISSSDRIMVQGMVSNTELGLYTVSAKIPAFINVLITIFSQAWGISSIKEFENSNDTTFYSKVLDIYIFICFGASVFLIAITKPFMKFYVSDSFYSAWRYVPFLLAAASFSAISSFYGSLYGALKKSTRNMITTVIAAVTNIVVNLIGIHFIGTYGAAIGTLVAYIVVAVMRMIDVGHFINIRINYLKFIVTCLLLILQSILVTVDFYGYIVSAATIIVFGFMYKGMLNTMITKICNRH